MSSGRPCGGGSRRTRGLLRTPHRWRGGNRHGGRGNGRRGRWTGFGFGHDDGSGSGWGANAGRRRGWRGRCGRSRHFGDGRRGLFHNRLRSERGWRRRGRFRWRLHSGAQLGRMAIVRGPGHRRLPTNDETLGVNRRLGSLRLLLRDDRLDRGGGLVVLEGAGVALHVVAEPDELLDDLLVVELDAEGLELFCYFMNALLRHTRFSLFAPRRSEALHLAQFLRPANPLPPAPPPIPRCRTAAPSPERRERRPFA